MGVVKRVLDELEALAKAWWNNPATSGPHQGETGQQVSVEYAKKEVVGWWNDPYASGPHKGETGRQVTEEWFKDDVFPYAKRGVLNYWHSAPVQSWWSKTKVQAMERVEEFLAPYLSDGQLALEAVCCFAFGLFSYTGFFPLGLPISLACGSALGSAMSWYWGIGQTDPQRMLTLTLEVFLLALALGFVPWPGWFPVHFGLTSLVTVSLVEWF